MPLTNSLTFLSLSLCADVWLSLYLLLIGNTMKFIWKYKKRQSKNKLKSSFCRNKQLEYAIVNNVKGNFCEGSAPIS